MQEMAGRGGGGELGRMDERYRGVVQLNEGPITRLSERERGEGRDAEISD